MEVEPEKQLLVYNGQVLVDEQPEIKEEALLTGIVECKGNGTSTNLSALYQTLLKFCQYVLIYNNSFVKRMCLWQRYSWYDTEDSTAEVGGVNKYFDFIIIT